MKRENSDRSPLEHLSHYSDLWNQYQVEKPRHSVSSDHAANSANFGNKSRSGIASLLGNFRKLNVLMHRNLLNYSRNILAYGIRRKYSRSFLLSETFRHRFPSFKLC